MGPSVYVKSVLRRRAQVKVVEVRTPPALTVAGAKVTTVDLPFCPAHDVVFKTELFKERLSSPFTPDGAVYCCVHNTRRAQVDVFCSLFTREL